MTESAKIAAANNYSRDVAAADAAYNQGVADLNNYVRDQQKAERDEIFNNVMTTIDSQTWNTTADLENYLYGKVGADGKRSGGVVNGLSDFQKAEIENRLNFYKGKPEQQAADDKFEQEQLESQFNTKRANVRFDKNVGPNDWTPGDNIRLTDGTTEYDVEIAGKVGGNDVFGGTQQNVLEYLNNLNVNEGEVFRVGTFTYMKKGDEYYLLRQREHSREEDWNDLIASYGKE